MSKPRLLCTKCQKNNGQTEEGTIRCSSAQKLVKPVMRSPGLRYEDCHYRQREQFGRPVRSSDQLKQLNREAVTLKLRDPQSLTPETIEALEVRICGL